jgi:ribose 1,5-bisphosphate isomerase
MDEIDKIEQDIKSLAIQGATNVAKSVLDGILIAGSSIPDDKTAYDYLKSIGQKLAFARPTEPLAQNAIRFIFAKKDGDVLYYHEKADEFKKILAYAKNKITINGAKIIKEGGNYLTHCHSSTVTTMLINSNKAGMKLSVIATETRPLYQGRLTVKELLNGGIEDVTMIIDDAVSTVLSGKIRPIDGIIIGADLVSDRGFVNKIGSLSITLIANKFNIPLYIVSTLLKYDPRVYSDALIEKRSGMEIWPDYPKNLKIFAPAFDFVPYDSNIKIICEEGIIEGYQAKEKTESLYNFIKED